MSDPVLIYGATGYSGHLVARLALDHGLRPVLGGRDVARLTRVAGELGLEYRAASLADTPRLDAALHGIRVVLHAAGPFSHTSAPMVEACLRAGAHYLDLTGEVAVVEALAARDAEARRRGTMIMPGVGFDVVAGDCLAAHVARRLPAAERLAVGLCGLRFITRGTAKTVVEAVDYGVVRRGGVLTRVPIGSLQHAFDFGSGPQSCLNVSWGDVASAYYTTGIPNIEVFAEATPLLRTLTTSARSFGWLFRLAPWQAWFKAAVDLLPEGPTAEQRAAVQAVLVAEASDRVGRRVVSRLRTPEAYAFTAMTAPAIAARVLDGDIEPGFQTPARVYGSDFVLSFAGVSREDLE